MALSINALVTEVHSRIGRVDMSSDVQDVLLQQITFLETLRYWPWRMTRNPGITLGSATWAHDVPDDFGEDLALVITEDNKEDYLERLALNQFLAKHPDPSKNSVGQPTQYTIGVASGTASAGLKQVWFPHPADGTYTTEFIYYNRRADCTATDMPTGFTELEMMVLIFRAAAHIEGSILGYSKCSGTPTCKCNACCEREWMGALESRYSLERTRDKAKWKMPKKQGHGIGYDVRGNQTVYNV